MKLNIDKKISRDMKYIALYSSLGYFECAEEIYEKKYNNGVKVIIYSNSQKVMVYARDEHKLTFLLNTHESFVLFELLDRLLMNHVELQDIAINFKENQILVKNYQFKCYDWECSLDKSDVFFNDAGKIEVIYKSRLKSGIIQFENIIRVKDLFYDKGLFEYNASLNKPLYGNKGKKYLKNDFWIIDRKAIKYIGNKKKVIVPEGIIELEICLFWDNQVIEEIVLPNSLINIGGDTFYNCSNLKKLIIPEHVSIVGDNPFGGCIQAEITNNSSHLKSVNGVIFTEDLKSLVYYPINDSREVYDIPETTEILGKHCFYACKNLLKIKIPKTVWLIKNNPFSGCKKLLHVNNESKNYVMEDQILYNKNKSVIIGALESLNIDKLIIKEGVKSIGRNAFWNCKKIKGIHLSKSIETIGYNPFVGCSKISFTSDSPSYKVFKGVLYNHDFTKLVCCPSNIANGHLDVLDSVMALERGAFSGCENLSSINLKNVNTIGKSCFSNCSALEQVYCPDWVTFIGECAFAHSKSLSEISYYKDTFIDMNAFINIKSEIIVRDQLSSYLIESENLYTLKTLNSTYNSKIDLIYIDPPYNTNISYINYKDAWAGDSYHNFMKARLDMAYPLLSDKGFLIIHIDENELENLVDLCTNYFEIDKISIHKWRKKNKFFDENRVVLNLNKKKAEYEYIIVCKNKKAQFNKLYQPYLEGKILKQKLSDFPLVFDFFGTTSSAKDEIKNIFGNRDAFSTPKPIKLTKEIIRATTSSTSTILDYFAGSGTVGEATMELNHELNSKKKFLLVTNDENDICKNITHKRLSIAQDKYNENVIHLIGRK